MRERSFLTTLHKLVNFPTLSPSMTTDTQLSLQLSERSTADFEMIGNGGFAPLTGFLGSEDWKSVCDSMTLSTGDKAGEYWPIPIVLPTDLECSVGDVIALTSDEGKALGSITISEIFERDLAKEAKDVYLTDDTEHPGVAAINEEGARCIAGDIQVDALPDHEKAFSDRQLTPAESTQAFAERGWKTIVAFQTRNPIHRAHEYITKVALEIGRRPLYPPARRHDQGRRRARRRSDAAATTS